MKRMNVLNKALLVSMIAIVSSNASAGLSKMGAVIEGLKVATGKVVSVGEDVFMLHHKKSIAAAVTAVAAVPFAFGKVRKGTVNVASKLVQKVWKKKAVRKSIFDRVKNVVVKAAFWKKPIVKKTLWRKVTGLFGL